MKKKIIIILSSIIIFNIVLFLFVFTSTTGTVKLSVIGIPKNISYSYKPDSLMSSISKEELEEGIRTANTGLVNLIKQKNYYWVPKRIEVKTYQLMSIAIEFHGEAISIHDKGKVITGLNIHCSTNSGFRFFTFDNFHNKFK